MRLSLLYSLVLAPLLFLNAQTDSLIANKSAIDSTQWKGLALNTGVGARGFTIGITYRTGDHFAFRLESSALIVEDFTYDVVFSGQKLSTLSSLTLVQAGLLVDYYPWKNSAFRLIGGVNYLARQTLKGRGFYPDAIKYGELSFEGSEIGYVEVEAQVNRWLPHLGVAIGRSRPKNALGLSLELGGMMWGKPNIDMKATGMLENTEEEEEKIENNLEQFQWWPYLQLSLNLRL